MDLSSLMDLRSAASKYLIIQFWRLGGCQRQRSSLYPKGMKIAFSLALLTVAGFASASFTLVMVADSFTNRVHRYDGDNFAYLGSFGATDLNHPFGIAVNKSQRRAYVADTTGITTFDYNTGEYISNFNVPGMYFNNLALASNGNLILSGYLSNTISVYTPTGTLVTSFVPSGFNNISGCLESGGFYYGVGVATGSGGQTRIAKFNSAGVVQSSLNISASGGDIFQGSIAGNELTFACGNSGVVVRTTTALTSSQAISFARSGETNPRVYGVGFGHGNKGFAFYEAFTTSSSTTQYHLASFDRVNGNLKGNITISAYGQIATVLAPEPGTMTVIGLAGLAALRRRRK